MTMTTKDTQMPLIKRDAPKFENCPETDETVFDEQGSLDTYSPEAQVPPQAPEAQSAVVALAQTPFKVSAVNPMAALRGAIHVEYDTFKKLQIKASGFVLVSGDSKINLGDTIHFEVMSYQPSYVVSPGVQGAEAGALVRYSHDGKFTKDGRSCLEYLNELLRDYPQASIKERCVVVLDLIAAPKATKDVSEYLEAEPYVLDLPPSSRKSFESYQLSANYKVGKGRLSADRVQFLKASITERSGLVRGSKTDWEVAEFSPMP